MFRLRVRARLFNDKLRALPKKQTGKWRVGQMLVRGAADQLQYGVVIGVMRLNNPNNSGCDYAWPWVLWERKRTAKALDDQWKSVYRPEGSKNKRIEFCCSLLLILLRLLTWSPEGGDEARRERGVEHHRGQKTASDTDERNTQHGIQPLSESRVYETRRAILQSLLPTLTLD